MNQVEICDRAIAKIDKRIEALQVTRESWVSLRFSAQCSRDDMTAELDLGCASVDETGVIAPSSSKKR